MAYTNSQDPFWMTAKFDGTCFECRGRIFEGERIVWDPGERKGYCSDCGYDLIGEDTQTLVDELSEDDLEDLNA
jgi:hypothetical protein